METAPAHRNIVLIGFMGSGKSSIGRKIAPRLGFRFIDTDQLVVERNGAQITEIFKTHGEAFFRDEETRALESLVAESGNVIATGGGIILRERNVELLRSLGLVVWLSASEEMIFNRVTRNDKRPLMQTANPRETIHNLLTQRSPLYEAAAHFIMTTCDKTKEQAAEQIIAEVMRR